LNRNVLGNLRLQLFCAVLLSLLVGTVVFCVSFFLGSALLDKTIYGQSFADKMADQQFSKLQSYVKEEQISLDTLQRLNPWCSRGEKVYLTIYLDDTLIYESHTSSKESTPLTEQGFDPNLEDPDNEYILTLQGNVKVRTFLYYYAGDAFYFWMTVLSGLMAFLAFSMCFVLLINRKVNYVTQLKEELDILSSGQLEYPVTVIGSDELGELASGIDQMRRSILKHQEAENQIRSANSELITAMSHDLRTPLTSLLAYLEIIERKKYADEEQLHALIHKSVGQTMRIRQMADDLAEVMEKLEISDANVLGISQGGMIAQYLAIDHPHLVGKLVLGVTMSRLNDTARKVITDWIRFAVNDDYEGITGNMLEVVYSEAYVKRFGKYFPVVSRFGKPKDMHKFAVLARACLTCNTYHDLEKIQCPVFVIGGKNDLVLSGEASEEIAEKLGCEIYMYENLGHSAYEEAPDFNRRVLEFFKSFEAEEEHIQE